jgi:hypothetical protein
MLKKGKPLPLKKPSTMQAVLKAIENGCVYRQDVIEFTKLEFGQVKSALHSLVFIGLLQRSKDVTGRSVYSLPGRWSGEAPDCLRGVSSVFQPRFTIGDNVEHEHP